MLTEQFQIVQKTSSRCCVLHWCDTVHSQSSINHHFIYRHTVSLYTNQSHYNLRADFLRNLRLSDHGQLLLNLCVALLGLYISFIFSILSSSVPPLCAIVSIALHYFMLVVFMVMAAEAVNLYMKLVIVFGQCISHYVIKVTVICWGK